jgi:long-chain acyl-CoA synthetase
MPQERRRRVPPSILEREKVHSFQKLLEGEPELEIADINPKEEIAALSYTGGTTGLPKGVILTHFNLVSNIYQMKAFTPYLREGNEVVTALLPFYHIYGQVVIMSASLSRGHTLLVFHGLNIEELLSSVEKYRATLFLGVPTLYNMIMGHPALGKYDLSSINYCISGADILHHETSRRFRELTGGKIIEGYGLTETSPATHFNPPERAKEGSIGIPITGTFAGIVDEGGEWAPIGEVGEIVISGPQVMLGYWKREDETKKVLMEKDGRVWLRTGDIGRVDDEGYFYFVEREKDLIKYKGYSVFPKEVEDALLENPAIKEAGVIGIRDEKVGEIVKACVVPEKEWIGKVTEEEIKEWCRERLAVYKVPKIIEFVRSIPKTPVGKVLRRSLREK